MIWALGIWSLGVGDGCFEADVRLDADGGALKSEFLDLREDDNLDHKFGQRDRSKTGSLRSKPTSL